MRVLARGGNDLRPVPTRALAPKVGYELIELESVTCCGAGDIHEAEPDYYLHLNPRILSYAAATGADTLMTVRARPFASRPPRNDRHAQHVTTMASRRTPPSGAGSPPD